eukprot:TRINITY_DN2325_c0_g1_i15.p5 TRINITY_DN2325_c0_g1~~TRINITY_DN2325_c0_g1_i15.p5  ORF type:complete len:205 (-),score=29.95 TRINITY_DN2325_c0_g1_i15:2557-3171(-)
MVVMGVGIVTVTDFTIRPLGVVIAMLSVIGSGSQQILCRDLQKRLNMQSTELLLKSAWPQGMIMLTFGPFLDFLVSKNWIFEFNFTNPIACLIGATCIAAIFVNISQFMALRGITAVAYSVMGHMKTILVLLGGYYFFGEVITYKKGIGMALAVCGMITYGYLSIQAKKEGEQKSRPSSEDQDLEKIPLSKDIENGSSSQKFQQ